MTIAMLAIPPLIPAILGNEWILASKYIIVLIPIAFLNLIYTPFMMIFVKLHLTKQYTIWALIRLLILSIVLFTCYSFNASVFNTLVAYAIGLALCYNFAYAYILVWANSGHTLES